MPNCGSSMRQPRPYDRARLRRAALDHLARYATSSANLARVLERRLARAAARGADNPADTEDVAAIIAELTRLGLLDDEAYARAKAEALRRRGTSARGVAAALSARGLSREAAAEWLAGEGPDAERCAAWALARRRRLGPFRPAEERAARRERDLAALARAGFDLGTALAVVDSDCRGGSPDAADAVQ